MQSHPGCEEHNRNKNPDGQVTNEYVLNIAFFSFLGFMFIQIFVALAANSHAMLADSSAMAVDSTTYLFNMAAERLKRVTQPHWTPRQRRLRRLYLELVPPAFSMAALVAITIVTLNSAVQSLLTGDGDNQPNIEIILIFSSINLCLDLMNVGCFSRVQQRFLGAKRDAAAAGLNHSEDKPALEKQNTAEMGSDPPVSYEEEDGITADESAYELNDDDDAAETRQFGLNLNMCSAWTHICADTMRSLAVLMAALIATIFPDAVSPVSADSWGAIAVSIIILISLLPLTRGLILTALEIRQLQRQKDDLEAPCLQSPTAHGCRDGGGCYDERQRGPGSQMPESCCTDEDCCSGELT